MSEFITKISEINIYFLLILIFIFPLLESSLMIGFIVPGETSVILLSFIASHKYPIYILFIIYILCSSGAILGDYIGFIIGKRLKKYTYKLLQRIFKSKLKKIEFVILKLNGKAVFLGRFTAIARALTPYICGTFNMESKLFLRWNIIGGIIWSIIFSSLGWIMNKLIFISHKYISYASVITFIIILIIIYYNVHKLLKRYKM